MTVELFKKSNEYTDKDGEIKTATNFYLKVGSMLIPIEAKYFKDKETGIDKQYLSRKAVLSAMAEVLPDKPGKEQKANIEQNEKSKNSEVSPSKDVLPF